MNRLFIIVILMSSIGAIPKFFEIGFLHIIPHGLDHVLFILGLFFLSRNFGVLLFQMTLFTLAHSLTLGLALYGMVSVSTPVVEVAIALSIVFIAIENLFSEELSRWRPWIVFGFGLIHGLGFAHSFQENKIRAEEFLPAIFSFNVGIEMGQLVVVGLAYAVFGRSWKWQGYQKMIAQPASLLIAMSGLYWATQRIG